MQHSLVGRVADMLRGRRSTSPEPPRPAQRPLMLMKSLEDGRDPFPVYAEMRRQGRLLVAPSSRVWVTADHEIVAAILRDQRFGKADRWADQLTTPLSSSLLGIDPPAHTRLRKLAVKVFTPHAVDKFRADIEAVANDLLDRRMAERRMDFIDDFAVPLPSYVISEILGLPREDLPQVVRWGHMVGAALDGGLSYLTEEEVQQASDGLTAYFLDTFRVRRTAPRDDLLQRLFEAHDDEDRLSQHEMLAMCTLFVFAGYETTVNLLGNGLLALLDHPDALRQLAADPALLPHAIEEMLRYDAPVHFTSRMAALPAVYDGQEIPAGAVIFLSLAGANRDPAVFRDPDRFDIHRDNADQHLAFSSGIHYCLGARLARMEAEIGFRVLLARCTKLRQAGPAVRRPTTVLHALSNLPLEFEPIS